MRFDCLENSTYYPYAYGKVCRIDTLIKESNFKGYKKSGVFIDVSRIDNRGNKEEAMKILKSKLYKIELEKQEKEMNKLKGINESINFGSQIRSYVLEPYTLVKDARSGYETSQASKVLDGNIQELIESVLKVN